MAKRYHNLGDIQRFTRELFDRKEPVRTGALITQGILESESPHISAIYHATEGGNSYY